MIKAEAESQANLAYPEDIIDATPLAAYPNWIDRNLPFREGFVNGYKQAEKDLALTWEDMDRIITASNIVADLHYSRKREMTSWRQYCEEVLKRFKEAKR